MGILRKPLLLLLLILTGVSAFARDRRVMLHADAVVSSSSPSGHAVNLAITWVLSGDPPAVFLIERSAVAGGPYTVICGGTGQPLCPTAAPTASYVDTAGVLGGQTWYYVSAASNLNAATGLGGVGPLSTEVKAVIPFLPIITAPGVSAVPQ